MRDIEGYEGLYAATEDGQIWSYRSKKFLKPSVNHCGYPQVILSKDNNKKCYFLHKLIALTYIPNPTGLPEVNHKSEIKTDNSISNLEWCDSEYNNNFGTRTERTQKKVYCVELDKVFNGVREAARELGIKSHSNISACCKGRYKTASGYHWKYVEEVINHED